MKIQFTLCIVVLFGLMGRLQAQDPHFSQFSANPLYMNPGFTGSGSMHRLTMAYRIQWPNLPQAYNTTLLSYDQQFTELNSGFGMTLLHDRAGEGALASSTISGLYSYKIRTNSGWIFSPGLQLGYTMRNLNYSHLVFEDQVGFGRTGQAPGTTDPLAQQNLKASFVDFGSGLLVYNKTAWLGATVHHLNKPNQSLSGNEQKLSARYSVHGGMQFPLYKGVYKRDRINVLAPSFIYNKQHNFQQLDLGLHFYYDPVMLGVWHRGILLADENGRSKQDAISFLFGLRFQQMKIGYSYDFTISSLGSSGGGAHEISLGLNFRKKESHKLKRKDKLIPCPAFLDPN